MTSSQESVDGGNWGIFIGARKIPEYGLFSGTGDFVTLFNWIEVGFTWVVGG